jgi:hypothetical protein
MTAVSQWEREAIGDAQWHRVIHPAIFCFQFSVTVKYLLSQKNDAQSHCVLAHL